MSFTNNNAADRTGIEKLDACDQAMDAVNGGFGVMEVATAILPFVGAGAVAYWQYLNQTNNAEGRRQQRLQCQRMVNNFTEGALEDIFYMMKGMAALPVWVKDRWANAWENVKDTSLTTAEDICEV